MKRTSLFIFFCLIAAYVLAQDPFVVYSTKGEVMMPGKRKKVIVKAGDKISSTNTITIGEGSGITLLCKNGTFFSTTEPGTHLLSKFNDSCHKSNSGLLNSFFRFLWDQATTKQVNLPGKNRKNYFDNIVHRTGPLNTIWINSQSFDTTNYSGIKGDFGFYWLSYINAKEYEFSLYAAPNTTTPFYKVMVRELRMPFVDLASKLKPGNSYYWTANIKGEDESSLYVLNYATKETYDSVLTTIKQQRPPLEEPAEEAYRTAFMLEYAHYFAEAYQHYTKAADLGLTNTLYKSTLVAFKKEFEIK